jgi:NAD(P)-dependent dehydrogenase (short-subunit alcohol dehydrogenase family)
MSDDLVVAVVTGASRGAGAGIAHAIGSHGCTVYITGRSTAGSSAAQGTIDETAERVNAAGGQGIPVRVDHGDDGQVRALFERIRDEHGKVDILVNNAAIMATPETRVGPGWEAQFATNHLGHFALVNRLWPAIAQGARVVSVSSRGHHRSAIRWDDVHFERGYDKWQAYGQSKTANVLFAVHLDTLAHTRGVRAFSVHPGGILTNLVRYLTRQDRIDLGLIDEAGNDLVIDRSGLKTPEQGAATQVWAATSPQLDGMGGRYCEDCDIAEPAAEPGPSGVRDYAIDPAQATRLWTLSAELTGVDAFV